MIERTLSVCPEDDGSVEAAYAIGAWHRWCADQCTYTPDYLVEIDNSRFYEREARARRTGHTTLPEAGRPQGLTYIRPEDVPEDTVQGILLFRDGQRKAANGSKKGEPR